MPTSTTAGSLPHLTALCLFLALGANSIPAQNPDIRLSSALERRCSPFDPDVAAEGDAIYVAWQDQLNAASSNCVVIWPSDIFFNRSLDRGATWLASEVRLNRDAAGTAMSLRPTIAVAGASVYVTWLDGRDGTGEDIYFNRSLDRGTSWLTNDIRLDTTSPPGVAETVDPQIAAVGSTVYVTWWGAHNGQYRVFVNRSLDGGSTWLATPTLISDPESVCDSREPQIVAEGSKVFVTWYDRGPTGGDVYFARSLDQGASWSSPPQQLNTTAPKTSTTRDCAIAAAGDNVYVAWHDARIFGRQDVYLNRSNDGGVTWLATDVRIDSKLAPVSSGSVQLSASGSSVYAVWSDHRFVLTGSDVFFNRSLDAGNTWLTQDVRLNTNPPGSIRARTPRISGSGPTVYVSWAIGGKARVNRSLDSGTSWLANDLLVSQSPSTVVSNPSLAASGSAAYLAWVGGGLGGLGVYFNIPFGLQPYGNGKAGSGGVVPTLTGIGSPHVGQAFSLDVVGGLGAAPATVLIGGSKSTLPILGGTVLVTPLLAPAVMLGGTPGAAGAGTLTLPVTIPPDEAFVGLGLFFQVLSLDAGATSGVSMTNGMELWIG